jgi:hypothetical protein
MSTPCTLCGALTWYAVRADGSTVVLDARPDPTGPLVAVPQAGDFGECLDEPMLAVSVQAYAVLGRATGLPVPDMRWREHACPIHHDEVTP